MWETNCHPSNEKWSINQCRNPIEPPEHWRIKKAFLTAHKQKYPKDRLLAITSTFYNMEFMGNRYDPKLECLISSLTSQVPEVIEYRNKRKRRLQRTFVSATDASKAKCLRTGSDIPKTNDQKVEHKKNEIESNSKMVHSGYLNHFKVGSESDSTLNLPQTNTELLKKVKSQPGFRGKLVLYIHNPTITAYQVVVDALAKIQYVFTLKRTDEVKDNKFEYVAEIENEVLVKDFAESINKARQVLGPKLLSLLQETCFTIMFKTQLEGQSINKTDTQSTKSDTDQNNTELLPSDNKGTRIMKLMGWTGQGLGKNKDGREKPIEVSRNVNRMGLCSDGKDIRDLHETFIKQLEIYKCDTASYNLVFSNEFSSFERKVIHEIAGKLKLKSKSYGSKNQRQLVISKKMGPWEIVEHLLANGDETANHKLLRPTKIT